MLKFILDLQKDRFVVDFALIRTVRGNFAVSREKIKNHNISLRAHAGRKPKKICSQRRAPYDERLPGLKRNLDLPFPTTV